MAKKQYERLQMLIQAKMWFVEIKEQDSGKNPIVAASLNEVIKRIKDEIDSEEDRLFGTGSAL